MSEVTERRSVYVVEGMHPTTPGRILTVCDSLEAAETAALCLVNVIRSDVGLPPAIKASEFKEALRAAEIARQVQEGDECSAHQGGADPLVSIEQQDLIDAEAALARLTTGPASVARSGDDQASAPGVMIWSESRGGWWSNNQGWISDEEGATVFTIDEAAGVQLPISVTGDEVFIAASPRPKDQDDHGLENPPFP